MEYYILKYYEKKLTGDNQIKEGFNRFSEKEKKWDTYLAYRDGNISVRNDNNSVEFSKRVMAFIRDGHKFNMFVSAL